MRYLGIDYGTKRIGIAISDERGIVAFPHSVIAARRNTDRIDVIFTIIRHEKIEAIIIGFPVDFAGKERETAGPGGEARRGRGVSDICRRRQFSIAWPA